jgi:predicted transcriptional regulator
MFTQKQAKLLGILDTEINILNTSSTDTTILKMSKNLNIPRSTLYPYVDNLVTRKLLLKIKRGKRFVYRTKSQEDLASLFLEMSNSIAKTKSMRISDLSTQVKFFVGRKQLSEAWLLIGNQPIGSTVTGIQSSKSLRYSIPKVPHATLRKNHNLFISRKIFLEGYCEADMYETVASYLQDRDTLEETLPDFENRTAITYLLKKDSLNTTSELWLLSEGVLIIDWKDEFGILIQNTSIGLIIRSLLKNLKPTLRIANYTEEMNKALTKIKKNDLSPIKQ